MLSRYGCRSESSIAVWSWIPLLWKLNRAAGKEQKEQIPWGAVTNYYFVQWYFIHTAVLWGSSSRRTKASDEEQKESSRTSWCWCHCSTPWLDTRSPHLLSSSINDRKSGAYVEHGDVDSVCATTETFVGRPSFMTMTAWRPSSNLNWRDMKPDTADMLWLSNWKERLQTSRQATDVTWFFSITLLQLRKTTKSQHLNPRVVPWLMDHSTDNFCADSRNLSTI